MRSTQECDLSRFEALARKVREARGLLVRALNDQLAGVYVWQRVVRLARAVCLSLPQNLNKLLVQLVRVGESFSLRKLLHYFLVLLDVLVDVEIGVDDLVLASAKAPGCAHRPVQLLALGARLVHASRAVHLILLAALLALALLDNLLALLLLPPLVLDTRLLLAAPFLALFEGALAEEQEHLMLLGFDLLSLLSQSAPLFLEARLLLLAAVVVLLHNRFLLF